MVYFADGTAHDPTETPDEMLGDEPGVLFGWLDKNHTYRMGACPPGVLRRLENSAENPVCRMRGYQSCCFCSWSPLLDAPWYVAPDGRLILVGDATISIVDRYATRWLAPTLVLHYIAAHSYLPPQALIDGLTTVQGKQPGVA